MTKNELQILVQVCDAAMSKGGVIAPDAMLTVSVARQNALNLVEKTPDGISLIPEKKMEQEPANEIGESANAEASKAPAKKASGKVKEMQ